MSETFDLEFARRDVNLALLHQEIEGALQKTIAGCSLGDYGCKVHLLGKPSAAELKAIEQIVAKHDPKAQTTEQQALARWKAEVEALSAKNWNALTPTEREEALRLQHEQMVFQATGKLPSVATPK